MKLNCCLDIIRKDEGMLDCFSSNWIPSCAEFIDVFNHSSCFRSMKIDLWRFSLFDALNKKKKIHIRRVKFAYNLGFLTLFLTKNTSLLSFNYFSYWST